MRFSIIRHGMTKANEMRLYCGFTDAPLSEEGKRGLIALKETIACPIVDIYITSGLERANETLRILYVREPDVIIEEFKEMNFGEFEMKSHDALMDKPEYQRWVSGSGDVSCPGGESRNSFENRVFEGLKRLFGMEAERFVVVCHGGVIVTIMDRLFPGQRSFYEWQPDFGRGYTIDILNGNAKLVSNV